MKSYCAPCYSSDLGYAGWGDAVLWFHSFMPSWITGVEVVDVPASAAGEAELRALLPTLKGKTLLLSATTQYVLWKVLRDDIAIIDETWNMSLEMPDEYGEKIRAELIKQRNDVFAISEQLLGMNETAFEAGVPRALEEGAPEQGGSWQVGEDWAMMEYQMRLTGPAGPAAGFFSALGPVGWILIVLGIVVAGLWLHDVFFGTDERARLVNELVREALRIGRPDLALKAISELEEKKGFNWGLGLGIGAALIGVTIFAAFLIGQAKKLAE